MDWRRLAGLSHAHYSGAVASPLLLLEIILCLAASLFVTSCEKNVSAAGVHETWFNRCTRS
jgi:hypothetical protein